jgi:DNA-3-methyladenine glycosylase
MNIIPESFYARDTVLVARELLGAMLYREFNGILMGGIITETEAYRFDDPACHAYRGKTERNAALFGPVGHTYVYFIYGNHYCVNVVSRTADAPSGGVLIRALKPVIGIEYMQHNRANQPIAHLTSGPGKLTQALAITKSDIGIDVTRQGPLYIAHGHSIDQSNIQATPRIGIKEGTDLLWRFVVREL